MNLSKPAKSLMSFAKMGHSSFVKTMFKDAKLGITKNLQLKKEEALLTKKYIPGKKFGYSDELVVKPRTATRAAHVYPGHWMQRDRRVSLKTKIQASSGGVLNANIMTRHIRKPVITPRINTQKKHLWSMSIGKAKDPQYDNLKDLVHYKKDIGYDKSMLSRMTINPINSSTRSAMRTTVQAKINSHFNQFRNAGSRHITQGRQLQ